MAPIFVCFEAPYVKKFEGSKGEAARRRNHREAERIMKEAQAKRERSSVFNSISEAQMLVLRRAKGI